MTLTRQEAPLVSVSGVWPQVNLLPPEVRARRRLKRTKQLLLLGVAVAVLVAILGYVGALTVRNGAEDDLAQVEDENFSLLAEQATYSEVPDVLGRIDDAETDRAVGMSTEILWKDYLDALRAVTPAEVSYDSMTVTAATPMQGAPAATDVLAGPSIGQIAFTARSLSLPDTASWLDAIRAVPGLADPWFATATVTDEEGVVYFQISATVQLTDVALANRYTLEGNG
ncbi:PilN domain-containing protein [Cellulomonas hominis]